MPLDKHISFILRLSMTGCQSKLGQQVESCQPSRVAVAFLLCSFPHLILRYLGHHFHGQFAAVIFLLSNEEIPSLTTFSDHIHLTGEEKRA